MSYWNDVGSPALAAAAVRIKPLVTGFTDWRSKTSDGEAVVAPPGHTVS
jgi:hypothetical protein